MCGVHNFGIVIRNTLQETKNKNESNYKKDVEATKISRFLLHLFRLDPFQKIVIPFHLT